MSSELYQIKEKQEMCSRQQKSAKNGPERCKFQILYETNFLTEILKMRHFSLWEKNRNRAECFLFWENLVLLRIYLIEL